MPKYRVKHESFLNGRLVQAGQVIEYSGNAGPNLEPVDDAAKKAQAAYQKKIGVQHDPMSPDFPLKMAQTLPNGGEDTKPAEESSAS